VSHNALSTTRSEKVKFLTAIATATVLIFANDVGARNYPCSGSKGGVSHCDGERFVCNDGSYSQSKKTCSDSDSDSKDSESKIKTIEPLTCKIVGVSDGDTLTAKCDGVVEHLKIRMAEIDAPEKAQPWGTKSKESLSNLCFGKTASIIVQEKDRYGRSVARVTCNGIDANLEQVKSGMAWAYTQYLKDKSIRSAEDQAKEKKHGLWVDEKPTPPWEFRRSTK